MTCALKGSQENAIPGRADHMCSEKMRPVNCVERIERTERYNVRKSQMSSEILHVRAVEVRTLMKEVKIC